MPESDATKPVVVSLFTQTITLNPHPYDAISYHWGASEGHGTVTVNGTDLPVTRSLHTTLKYMRHASLEKIIWIDGLCINQNNLVERSHQVAEMGRIYESAQCVRIWLGEATPDVEAAMNLVSRPNNWSDTDDRCIIKCIRSDRTGAIALTRLLERPYWRRMWIFQEIVLARHAVVHCGRFEAPWSHFLDMDKISGDQRLWAKVPMRELWVHDLRRAFFEVAQFCIPRDEAMAIHNVLYPTRNLRCSDPRDKLFALMGVCEISKCLEFAPNYTRSVRLVYTDFTRSLMNVDEDLSSILTAGLWNLKNGPDIELPTWVPDYRGSNGINIRYLAASFLEHFNAARGMQASHRYMADEQGELTQLEVHGFVVDAIQDIVLLASGEGTQQIIQSRINSDISGPNHCSHVATASLCSVFKTMIFQDPTLSPDSNPDRLNRLALGFAYDLMATTDKQSLDFSVRVNNFLASFQAPHTCPHQNAPGLDENLSQEALNKRFSRLMREDPEELYWYRQEYLARSKETSQGPTPSIFTTQEQRIGKGLDTVRPGDRIAVVFGCRVPVVIRPFRDKFKLVGPCYLSGAMDGELLGEMKTEFGTTGQRIILL